MQLSGKTILVTGGTDGIGREIALQAVGKGADVIVTGRNAARLDAMRDAGCNALSADLSSAAGVTALVGALSGHVIDILINNAGCGSDHDFREDEAIDSDDNDRCIFLNLNAPIRLTTALMPMLRSRPEAMVVNVTSGLAIAPNAGGPVYCATKAGLRSYTQAIRAQLAGTKVHVVEALPPVVDTQLTAGREAKKMSPAECAQQIVTAMERNSTEANVGLVKILQLANSISPALARKIMLRF
jgi:uncharacterized oxidoreductase